MQSSKEPVPSSCRFCAQDIIRDCAMCPVARHRINPWVRVLRVVFDRLVQSKKCAVLTGFISSLAHVPSTSVQG